MLPLKARTEKCGFGKAMSATSWRWRGRTPGSVMLVVLSMSSIACSSGTAWVDGGTHFTDGSGATPSQREGGMDAGATSATPSIANHNGVSGTGADDVWIVGSGGRTTHWDGTNLRVLIDRSCPDVECFLGSVWANGSSTWAAESRFVGNTPSDGTLLRWQDGSWAPVSLPDTPTGANITGVWGRSDKRVFAFGSYGLSSSGGELALLWVFDGTAWSKISVVEQQRTRGVWESDTGDLFLAGDEGRSASSDGNGVVAVIKNGVSTRSTGGIYYAGVYGFSSTDVWLVGSDLTFGGIIRHYDGSVWKDEPSTQSALLAVWGANPNSVWAVGIDGSVLLRAGGKWSPVSSGTTQVLRSIWGPSADDVWVVGDGGAILRCTPAGCRNAI